MINLLNKKIKSNEMYKILKTNPKLIFPIFFLICLMHYKYKIVGFIVSLITVLCVPLFIMKKEWENSTFIKVILIALTSLLSFYKLNFKSSFNFNWIITLFLAVNVFVLLFTLVPNFFMEKEGGIMENYWLATLIFILFLCTPFLSISKNNINMSKIILNPDIYVIFFTIVLGVYYILYPLWNEHLHLVIFSLVIPLISHFINNKWFESRALFLCLFIIFDIFDIKNYGF